MRIMTIVILLAAAYLWVSNQGYADATQQSKHCAGMVEQDAWPAEVCK